MNELQEEHEDTYLFVLIGWVVMLMVSLKMVGFIIMLYHARSVLGEFI